MIGIGDAVGERLGEDPLDQQGGQLLLPQVVDGFCEGGRGGSQRQQRPIVASRVRLHGPAGDTSGDLPGVAGAHAVGARELTALRPAPPSCDLLFDLAGRNFGLLPGAPFKQAGGDRVPRLGPRPAVETGFGDERPRQARGGETADRRSRQDQQVQQRPWVERSPGHGECQGQNLQGAPPGRGVRQAQRRQAAGGEGSVEQRRVAVWRQHDDAGKVLRRACGEPVRHRLGRHQGGVGLNKGEGAVAGHRLDRPAVERGLHAAEVRVVGRGGHRCGFDDLDSGFLQRVDQSPP